MDELYRLSISTKGGLNINSPNMSVNPFGEELQGAMLDEVYKSAVGCLVNGTERVVSEHGDLADQYLRKAFKLSDARHQELLKQAKLEQVCVCDCIE